MLVLDCTLRKLISDVSNGPARPFVPFNWRRHVFNAVHGLGHPGVDRTRQTIVQSGLMNVAKVSRHTTPPIGDFKIPVKFFVVKIFHQLQTRHFRTESIVVIFAVFVNEKNLTHTLLFFIRTAYFFSEPRKEMEIATYKLITMFLKLGQI